MLNIFKCKNTCRDCEYYSNYKSQDELLPDKTVIKGKVEFETCSKMFDILQDIEPCELFTERTSKQSMTAAIKIKREASNRKLS